MKYVATSRLCFTLCSFMIVLAMNAQENNDADRKRKAVQVSGSLGLASGFYSSTRSRDVREPFNWNASARINIRFWDKVSIPIYARFSDRRFSADYDLPVFSRFGFSPSWDWGTAHIGWRNMSFSRYTMNGYSFVGGGLELRPGKFRFAAMYGRLGEDWSQPVIDPRNFEIPNIDLPNRRALALKVGYGTSNNYLDLIVFRASDVEGTGDLDTLSSLHITPKENLVVGSQFKFTLFKTLSLTGDFGLSGLTDNIQSGYTAFDEEAFEDYQQYEDYLEINGTSSFAFAGEARLGVRIRSVSFGVGLQRVDPFYQSFGLHRINDDRENITGDLSFGLFRNKLRLHGRAGLQRNNLKEYSSSSVERYIYNAGINLSTQKFTFSGNYGNFSTEQSSILMDVEDTLRVVNESQSYSGNMTFRLGEKGSHTIAISANHNLVDVLNSAITDGANTSSKIQTYRMTYSGGRSKEKKLFLQGGLNYNLSDFQSRQSLRYGGNLGLGTRLIDNQISARLNVTYNRSELNESSDGDILSSNISASYSISENQSFNFNFRFTNRNSEQRDPFREFRTTVNYALKF